MTAEIVELKDRSMRMLKKELILRNPLRQMGYEEDEIIPEGGFGAVLARAGVGKTALLVQLALNMMLRGRKVLHVSLLDPVNKVDLWYRNFWAAWRPSIRSGRSAPYGRRFYRCGSS